MFRVGDRVSTPKYGPGKIVVIDGGFTGVCHDDKNRGLHDLGGHTEGGFGWWYTATQLKNLKPPFKGNIK